MNGAPEKPQQQLQLDGGPAERLHPRQCVDLTEAVAAVPMTSEASASGETSTLDFNSGEIHEAIAGYGDFCQDLLRLTALELYERTLAFTVAANV